MRDERKTKAQLIDELKELRKRSEEDLRSLMENASSFAIYRLLRDRKKPDGFSVVFVSPSISDIVGVSDPMKFDTWSEEDY
jgi:hypothetical protein